MYDHIGLKVKDFKKSRRFYAAALAPLGLTPRHESATSAGFGAGEATGLWLEQAPAASVAVHIAFVASTRAAVKAFHAAALDAGGKDNGAPGPRPDYGPTYYAAFVHDPDGNNIEAVTHSAK